MLVVKTFATGYMAAPVFVLWQQPSCKSWSRGSVLGYDLWRGIACHKRGDAVRNESKVDNATDTVRTAKKSQKHMTIRLKQQKLPLCLKKRVLVKSWNLAKPQGVQKGIQTGFIEKMESRCTKWQVARNMICITGSMNRLCNSIINTVIDRHGINLFGEVMEWNYLWRLKHKLMLMIF